MSTNKEKAEGIKFALGYLENDEVYNLLKTKSFAISGLRAIEVLKEIAEDLENNK